MRVLFLTHRLPYTPNRGDRIRALQILRLLKDHADVDLVSLAHSAEEYSHAKDLYGLAASVTPVRVSRLRGLIRVAAVLPTNGTLTHAMLDSAEIDGVIRRIVAERRPDVVLAYCSSMARFALRPPLAGLPLVLDMVDVDSEKWRMLGQSATIPWRWIYATEARRLSRFEAEASTRARTVLVVNDRERNVLLRLAPSADVRVVPIGIDLDGFRPTGEPSEERRVCFCGVMSYAPNEKAMLWFAREVWPVVRARVPDARLSIVGSSPTRALYRLAAGDASIEVTGAVPDVHPYLWRSAISVAPLFVARGVQNKVFEAVAAGLPCVVTPAVREGLPAEVLAGCIEAGDAESFAAAVIDLLSRSPAERRAMAARTTLSGLGWNEQLRPLLKILTDAVAG